MSEGQYLTLVYKIESEGQRKALIHDAAWCAKSDTHVMAERDKLRAEANQFLDSLLELQVNHIRLGGERNKLFDECEKLKRENAQLAVERHDREQTLHIGIQFNDAEFVRSMQTLIAEHTSEDAAQLHEAKQTIERLNDELGRVTDQLEVLRCRHKHVKRVLESRDAQVLELTQTNASLGANIAGLEAQLTEAKAASAQLPELSMVQITELSMAQITEITASMPDGLAGFLGKWGLSQFAKAVWAAAQKGDVA